jgi:two-component system phosphate regulon sensor histidine kinase PhoR
MQSLKTHLTRLSVLTIIALLLGWLSGALLQVAGVLLLACLAWSLINTIRLYHWLDNTGQALPKSIDVWGIGIWSGIFERIRRMRKQSRDRSKDLEDVIRRFQSVTDALPDATLLLDQADKITWFNAAATKLLGLKTPTDLGQPVSNLIRTPDFINWLAVAGDVSSPLEISAPLDDSIRLQISATIYRSGQRLLILRDVTAVHLADRIRRDFVANVSHELRTPLTVFLGYLESLEGNCPAEISVVVERMQAQAFNMQLLVEDLLELSRIQAQDNQGDEILVDVPELLVKLGQQARELSKGKHKLAVSAESGLAVKGLQPDLESAFRNLIDNAIHYTPDGGSVTVSWQRDGDGASLVVSDTGIGIPKRDIPRLTERFYRVGSDRSRHTGGTGLGLAIVKHVLNAHQGRLDIESTLGEGSVFTAVFPSERCVEPASRPIDETT